MIEIPQLRRSAAGLSWGRSGFGAALAARHGARRGRALVWRVHELRSRKAIGHLVSEPDLPEKALSFRVQVYGMTRHRDLFTNRQLVALTTFSDLVGEARDRFAAGAKGTGLSPEDAESQDLGGQRRRCV
jgi:hypothetical protein